MAAARRGGAAAGGVAPRIEWMGRRVATSFAPDVTDDDAIRFLRAAPAVEAFLNGSGPARLMIFFQARETGDEGGKRSDVPELYVGESDSETLLQPAVYFLRNTAEDKPAVNVDRDNDETVIAGEVTPALLTLLESQLNDVFEPLIRQKADWGSADAEVAKEFTEDLDRFSRDVGEALRSVGAGVRLEMPAAEVDLDGIARNPSKAAKSDPDLVRTFEALMEGWCDLIERYLSDSSACDEAVKDREGPRGVIEWWRARMQMLTSITEQLKSRECRTVVNFITSLVSKSTTSAAAQDHVKSSAFALLRRWKALDVAITEAANEAKDNVKYLSTLEKFIEPLYTQPPPQIVDALPALLNSVKMVHTIARYLSNDEGHSRMVDLFQRITNQMIKACTLYVLNAGSAEEDPKTGGMKLWTKEPGALLRSLRHCLRLNDAYQTNYRLTKEALAATPSVKQFDWPDRPIFARFDLFCRRVIKLIDMFSTIQQFDALAAHRLEGMEPITERFTTLLTGLKRMRHDLLAFTDNSFDRDFVEFNVRINELEHELQKFINTSFEQIPDVMTSLALLRKFQNILQRESLKSDLDEKFSIIFKTYGEELEMIRDLYDRHRHNPPLPRNLPPVAGNIMWARHLLQRIEGPMHAFEANQTVLASKDAKRIVKLYNRVARTLVQFEYLWYQAWVDSIETAKAGLQATLIIRHPEDQKLYVNFDAQILQLIREAKCLDRMGIAIPESARVVLLQEEKFKAYYNDLSHALREYARITNKIIPVTAALLRPHIADLEYKLRPGMVTLTWTSMNIDAYKAHVHAGLHRLEELVSNVNDIIENRIEKNLKVVSRTLLVDLPDSVFTLDEFVAAQQVATALRARILQGKNLEVEAAVEDLISLIVSYPLDSHIQGPSGGDVDRIRAHYNHYMYSALLNATKSSLNALKKRVATRPAAAAPTLSGGRGSGSGSGGDGHHHHHHGGGAGGVGGGGADGGGGGHGAGSDGMDGRPGTSGGGGAGADGEGGGAGGGSGGRGGRGRGDHVRPFFEVDVQLSVPMVQLSPSLESVQQALNKCAVAVLACSKTLWDWGQREIPEAERTTFFDRITKDIEIVRVVLLLTGAVQSLRHQVASYLASFVAYEWLWKEDPDAAYKAFLSHTPQIDDFERELMRFMGVEAEIDSIAAFFNVGALSLSTRSIKQSLKQLAGTWRVKYSDNLHRMARRAMDDLTEYMKKALNKLARPVDSLDSLRAVMEVLREIRDKEACIDAEMAPIIDMYGMLEHYLPAGFMEKEELDQRSMLRPTWRRLVNRADEVTTEISATQLDFKRRLLQDVRALRDEVVTFRRDYELNGPMVEGLLPAEAMDRLRRYEDEYDIRARKRDLYCSGEDLFGLAQTEYAELDLTKRELGLLQKLYGLYRDVMTRMDDWKNILWSELVANIDSIANEMEGFANRCRKLPGKLRTWQAFKDLDRRINDFQSVLPLLQDLSNECMRERHWKEIEEETRSKLPVDDSDFRLSQLLAADLVGHKDRIEEICDAASKQAGLEVQIRELTDRWDAERLVFKEWKARGIATLQGVGVLIGDLEEAQSTLQAILTSRFIKPFRDECNERLQQLSNTSERLDLWLKVQNLWCSLESVFLTGDIARQLPKVAGKFSKIDKDWARIMLQAAETELVVKACENEVLTQMLPVMYGDLEFCQKRLDTYLEQKRAIFPRFYFVSNPVLLNILSKGSEPTSMQEYYEKIFDAVTRVEHDKKDKTQITQIHYVEGRETDVVELRPAVKTAGNIEDWLNDLLRAMQRRMKQLADECAVESDVLRTDLSRLRAFTNHSCGQYALLGIQLLWTKEIEIALSAARTKVAMKTAVANVGALLTQLTEWCREEIIGRMNRTKIETLVTIQVHQKDVSDYLQTRSSLSGKEDFEWLKQARFYWKPEEPDFVNADGACIISITDVDFNYQYEFLGVKERLVITPLTDRCYITLAQAIKMHLGGAPAGPAGTGKTETVKDMGRALGLYVVVTNCSSEMSYLDCAKIFKGLAMSGLWGCFDEFNRITLPVLSVVAQQILAMQNAKKANADSFSFPGDPQIIPINPVGAAFITMNPGYAGRQELPENLKALFRGVAMMVPDREIIIKVKLCSVGYLQYPELATKFFICYQLCEEQLSKQKHYDFGLRNILSVLRTAGSVKRNSPETNEFELLFRTLRDMNLSKLVAQDVSLFTSMLADLFPAIPPPKTAVYPAIEREIRNVVNRNGLVHHKTWVRKVIQLYETILVRHGIMVSGAAGSGKSKIYETLQQSLNTSLGITHRIVRMNPKSLREVDLYGQTNQMTGEWENGVFTLLWAKYNDRNLPYNTWIIMDGPVDTIWIESLNTVLDDNKILTVASGDRYMMTENTKIMFENENLNNASPATVSRAGIVFVSDVDLDWQPVCEAWIRTRPPEVQRLLRHLFARHVGRRTRGEFGHLFDFLRTTVNQVVQITRVGAITSCFRLLQALIEEAEANGTLPPVEARAVDLSAGATPGSPVATAPAAGGAGRGGGGGGSAAAASSSEESEESDEPASNFCTGEATEEVGVGKTYRDTMERMLVYAIAWSLGGLLEPEDRLRLDEYLRRRAAPVMPPKTVPGASSELTIYEWTIDPSVAGSPWKRVTPPLWRYPAHQEKLDFSNLLVPTMDTTRAIRLLGLLHHRLRMPVLMVGGPGTAKTSTALMYVGQFDPLLHTMKRINFSSATMPGMLQEALDAGLEKNAGKFRPPGGKMMTVFIDDISMPEINEWGDQPTNELTRQVIEHGGFYSLEKELRGTMKIFENLAFLGAMIHPGGGRNDLPARLKRQFFVFNMVLPDLQSMDDMYGQMLRGRFPAGEWDPRTLDVASKLTRATIELWRMTKGKMLPTPAKFHYIFNMRELSRVFQGVLLTEKDVIRTGGVARPTPPSEAAANLLRLWKHECMRVFQDKLVNQSEKEWFAQTLERTTLSEFGEPLAMAAAGETLFVNFLRDDVYNEDEVLVEEAPRIYEPGGTIPNIRRRAEMLMESHNKDFPATKLNLVLFEDALRHCLRIARILLMPRGSALLVGVGGSGKQSLTRLAAYVARSKLVNITLVKNYNVEALKADLKNFYIIAGHQRKSVTFVFTDAEIKDEAFLEYVNSILTTGEIAGLIPKDEMMAITADLQPFFAKDRPSTPETPDNLYKYFIETVRDNLHIVLCMSPVNPKFPERARKFPGLISATTIDWFLPWPEDALVAVSRGILADFTIDTEDPVVRDELLAHMGTVHALVVNTCDEYYAALRRRVYQTPKSYLSFIQIYKTTYAEKLREVKEKEGRVNLGLSKLVQGARDVDQLKQVLKVEKVKVQQAEKEVATMLSSLEVSSLQAEKEAASVAEIETTLSAERDQVEDERRACQADLDIAKPILETALKAVDSILASHIAEMKGMRNPGDIIRVVLDTILIILMEPLRPPELADMKFRGVEAQFIKPCFDIATSRLLSDTDFLARLKTFKNSSRLEQIREETIEMLIPYVDFAFFTPDVAQAASVAARGLCVFARGIRDYFDAVRIVRPKQIALEIADQKLRVAQLALDEARERLRICHERQAELKSQFDVALAKKQEVEDNAMSLQRKMEKASALILGLSEEKDRWEEDSAAFADVKRRLIGDCAVACAFISYCGPFNAQFRDILIRDRFVRDCRVRGIPVTPDLDVTRFLVDIGTVGDWNLQGLPTDQLSIQNGILVTQASRYPLLVDPQGQALTWIKNREAHKLPRDPTTMLTRKEFKDQLTFAMEDGKALIVVGVEEELDPLLDPVLEKRIVDGKGKRKMINVSDKLTTLSDEFRLYFLTRLPNPHFSPELQAKTTVVDFTVTQAGLEEQLLGRVIQREQKALEDQLKHVLEEVNANTKALLNLNAQLLTRLTQNEGNLLDDEELLGVLSDTKAKAAEVKEKLKKASETRETNSEKREQYRPVARRGSVLYFSIVDLSLVNVMYQTSLAQFVVLFMRSMDVAEKHSLQSKRVAKIIEAMTYLVYRYVNKGIYERDKLLFVFIVTCKILITDGLLEPSDVSLFLRGGAALDMSSVGRQKPKWITDEAAWLNVMALSDGSTFFKALPDNIIRNDSLWKRFYEDESPEQIHIPDYEVTLRDNKNTGPFLRLLLLRALRVDRTLLGVRQFVRDSPALGAKYVEPITDTIEEIYDSMDQFTPVIFLLSIGADPTEAIETLCKRRKNVVAVVSLGQGQEQVAMRALQAAVVNGSWVLLQNCELGLELMDRMEQWLVEVRESAHPDFRFFITALPHPKFPLGLLQMSTKVTNEPPNGLKAGLLRSFTTIVDQDRLERIDSVQWRQLTWALCFLHSVVQERRKFGPLGWCIPYEYNSGDLNACLTFLERHMYTGTISWPTLQYMVAEVQYGGKVTDYMDRRLFATYVNFWVSPYVLEDGFTYTPKNPIQRMPGGFAPRIPVDNEIEHIRTYAQSFPEVDSPEIFGLHPNADLTFRVKESTAFLETMADTVPKQVGGGGGGGGKKAAPSLEDQVTAQVGDFLRRLPEDYQEYAYTEAIETHLGGMRKPLNVFLYQEVQRFQRVIAKVRETLVSIQLAIRGEVVMTSELQRSMGDIFDARVPKPWQFTPAGDEFSWLSPTLGQWFTSLDTRNLQYRHWLTENRPVAFWITGFFNPQGFLTAMKQEVTRARREGRGVPKEPSLALDDVVYTTNVRDIERIDSIRSPPPDGVYVYGLYIEGAGWTSSLGGKDGAGSLVEAEPKTLYHPLPVLWVSAASRDSYLEDTKRKSLYKAPLYKYRRRGDRYLITLVDLPALAHRPEHWILRGVALLCSSE